MDCEISAISCISALDVSPILVCIGEGSDDSCVWSDE